MTQATLRERLHQYVNGGDETLLKMMYAIASEYSNATDDREEHTFSAADIRMFEERRAKRLSGESRTYTRAEARDLIMAQKLPDDL